MAGNANGEKGYFRQDNANKNWIKITEYFVKFCIAYYLHKQKNFDSFEFSFRDSQSAKINKIYTGEKLEGILLYNGLLIWL